MSFSRDKSPSRLAFSAKVTIVCTMLKRFGSPDINALLIVPPSVLRVSPGNDVMTAPAVPPTVISMDGKST